MTDNTETAEDTTGLTPEQWIAVGYKKFSLSPNLNKLADYGLQKLISDAAGKRYYITVYVYENYKKDYFQKYHGALLPYSFSPDVQFNPEGKMTVSCTFILNHNTTILDVEKQVHNLWVSLGKPYYSMWD